MSHQNSSSLSGLPAQFVLAMRTLFDIMDDKNTGYVHFSDIENRWRDDGTKGLPKGVLESLKKVTPPNGLISFNHFCTGLKICLLQNQAESARSSSSSKSQETVLDHEASDPSKTSRHLVTKNSSDVDHSQSGAKIPSMSRLSAMGSQQRTLSMPQLQQQMYPEEDNNRIGAELRNYASDARLSAPAKAAPTNISRHPLGPPKPPRLSAGLDRGNVMPEVRPPLQPPTERNLDRAEIRTALQKWQIGLMMNGQDSSKNSSESGSSRQNYADQTGRGSGDGKPSGQVDQGGAFPHKKVTGRRREPRRHTLQNGIDYNMLKRMKQIEQEKDVLMQGLQAVERAREWYLRHIGAVQERMKYLGKMGSHGEQWTEAQQERIELRRARVLEVNRHLALLCRWGSGENGDNSPLEDWGHMNLALPHHRRPPQQSDNPQGNLLVERLKHQNHLLTEEVSKKSERIAGLEREKTLLIRELFQLKSDLAGRRSGVGEEPAMLEEAAGGFM
ncbi:suppressor APC domain-containing protein 2 [Ischnura elegans]|uniref:suppressor APC domain-containing protein 2 n=1 Tax=Ischnura elegans TaxID=197161 RepID=UPI001ED884BE|nr:suppressor APC domain-containing protein 2 [Ischnura elegans]